MVFSVMVLQKQVRTSICVNFGGRMKRRLIKKRNDLLKEEQWEMKNRTVFFSRIYIPLRLSTYFFHNKQDNIIKQVTVMHLCIKGKKQDFFIKNTPHCECLKSIADNQFQEYLVIRISSFLFKWHYWTNLLRPFVDLVQKIQLIPTK